MQVIPRGTKTKTKANTSTNCSDAPLSPRTEDAAAQAMWLFYRDHKPQLITDIKAYRAGILAQLMAGVAVEEAFAPYFKPAEPTK